MKMQIVFIIKIVQTKYVLELPKTEYALEMKVALKEIIVIPLISAFLKLQKKQHAQEQTNV